MDEEDRDAQPEAAQIGGQAIDADQGAGGVGIEKGEGRALELTDDRVEGGTGHHRQIGKGVGQGAERLFLVDRVAKRPEQGHGQGFDVVLVDQAPGGRHDFGRIEVAQDGAAAIDPFVDADDAAALHHLRRHHQPSVLVDPTAPGQGHQVLEALRRDQAHPSAGPGGQDVGHRGRAEPEALHPRQQ